jgi:hypothetical protein
MSTLKTWPATILTLVVLIIAGSAVLVSRMSAEDNGELRFRARGEAAINGIEAELRGDFRVASSPFRERLSAELQNINIPLGTAVAFCLVRSTGITRVRVARVKLQAGIKVAEFDLDTNSGNVVPTVQTGDRIQTRQSRTAPFNSAPTCGSPLLVSATFR